jgi:two-component system chemotaxis response regulator CheY
MSADEQDNANERKALIIDDYFLIRRNHKLLLEKLGFSVIEAGHGQDGLDKLAKHGPDYFSLIIVDLIMPEMSGAEFLIKCRKEYGDSLPPVLVCSSASEVPLVKKIVALGIAGYIVKPVDYKALIAKLEDMFPDIAGR